MAPIRVGAIHLQFKRFTKMSHKNEKSKHTPGPWEISEGYHQGMHIITMAGSTDEGDTAQDCARYLEWEHGVYEPYEDETGEETRQWEEVCANVQLIASAPELLQALKHLVHLHMCEQEGIESGMPSSSDWYHAVENAAIIINKAEGSVSNV